MLELVPKPRPGDRWQAVPSLPDVYEEHHMPPAKGPTQISVGEERMLQKYRALRTFTKSQKPSRRLVRTRNKPKEA